MTDGTDHALMQVALEEARLAADAGEVPIGAVVAVGGEVVARRHNEREAGGDPTAHAEVLALRDAAAATGSWRLDDATLLVTNHEFAVVPGVRADEGAALLTRFFTGRR